MCRPLRRRHASHWSYIPPAAAASSSAPTSPWPLLTSLPATACASRSSCLSNKPCVSSALTSTPSGCAACSSSAATAVPNTCVARQSAIAPPSATGSPPTISTSQSDRPTRHCFSTSLSNTPAKSGHHSARGCARFVMSYVRQSGSPPLRVATLDRNFSPIPPTARLGTNSCAVTSTPSSPPPPAPGRIGQFPAPCAPAARSAPDMHCREASQPAAKARSQGHDSLLLIRFSAQREPQSDRPPERPDSSMLQCGDAPGGVASTDLTSAARGCRSPFRQLHAKSAQRAELATRRQRLAVMLQLAWRRRRSAYRHAVDERFD